MHWAFVTAVRGVEGEEYEVFVNGPNGASQMTIRCLGPGDGASDGLWRYEFQDREQAERILFGHISAVEGEPEAS